MTHDFEGETHPEREPTIADEITGAEWDGFPLMEFSHERLMQQEGIVNYVWPDEGKWVKGKWRFHKGNRPQDDEDKEPLPYPTTPMMIDASSARAYQVCIKAMNEKNVASCKEKCESARWWTVYIISEVFWPSVSFGGR